MKDSQYNEQIHEINMEAEERKKALRRQYVIENTKHGKNSVITGLGTCIMVTNIRVTLMREGLPPVPVYYGRKLKKNGEPTKREIYDSIYGDNVDGGWRKEDHRGNEGNG